MFLFYLQDEKNIQQASDRFGKFAQSVSSEEERTPIQLFEQNRDVWLPVSRQVVDLAQSGQEHSCHSLV
nr:hypothetical protein [uncultured Desulfobulbus sp.]